MAELVVRPYESGDAEDFWTVKSLTYNDGLPIPEERRQFKYARPFVAAESGRVSGVFNVLDMTATRGASTLKCAGVAGVAVAPDRRQAGVGGAMMGWLPKRMREEGVHLCSLYAFRESYYRRYGYEVCGKRVKIKCPTHRLPKAVSTLPIRRLSPRDWREIAACYETFAHRRSGLNIRSELQWERVLNENKALAIYVAGDPIEAYVAVSHATAFWEDQHLSEVAWSTHQGYEAVFSIFAQIGANKTALTWHEPSDSPFLATQMDQGVQTEIVRPIMFRANDVPACLRAMETTETGSFSIEVEDELVPENRGPWQVRFSPDGIEVEHTDEADMRVDVRYFVQAYLGEPSLLDLLRNDLVVIGRASSVDDAIRLFQARPTYCMDFF